jgi:DNA-binding transcriptional MerR regulator
MAMLIGELARRAGVKAQTIRYYETLGLLSPVQRSASGYRSYSAQAVEELQFIRKAQSLGFSLDDVRQILDVARAGRLPCSRVLAIAERHLVDLDQRIAQLSELRDDLTRAVNRWKDGGVSERCASTLCGLISEAAEPLSPQSVPMASSSRSISVSGKRTVRR